MSELASRVAAVVVDFHAGSALAGCVDSLRDEGLDDIVVVENGEPGSAAEALAGRGVTLVEPGVNLGYGRTEAYSAAMKATQNAEGKASLDLLIKLSLKELMRG